MNKNTNFKDLSDDFNEYYQSEKRKLPFHINLIDELHANENAHSRILVKLLQYNHKKTYPILESFIEHFLNPENESIIKIEQPKITAEKQRIDALTIYSDSTDRYAIIVENKIHDADDRKNQIINYINNIKQDNIKQENIYIVYLTASGGSPDENSLPKIEKDKFKDKYLELTYSSDIIPWLEEFVLPNLRYQEKLLISALEQYIDHLKGIFYLRKSDILLDKTLVDYIQNQICLKKNTDFLDTLIKEGKSNPKTDQDNKNYLFYLERTRKIHFLKQWFKEIEKMYNQYRPFAKYNIKYPKIGIILHYKKFEFTILIEFSNSKEKPYFGISTHFTEGEGKKNKEIFELIGNLEYFNNINFSKHSKWYVKINLDYSNIFEGYKNVVDKIIKNLNLQ